MERRRILHPAETMWRRVSSHTPHTLPDPLNGKTNRNKEASFSIMSGDCIVKNRYRAVCAVKQTGILRILPLFSTTEGIWPAPGEGDLESSTVQCTYIQSWAYCAEERKSASFFLLRRNANLGFQKRNCALCALKF
jgi:hypothetical protein